MSRRQRRATPYRFLVFILLLWCWGPASGELSAREEFSKLLYDFEIKRDWLVMPDGVRLSVTYFKPLPQEEGELLPVLLELLPYRKDDQFFIRDYPIYSYFARHGYVCAKVDIRGTGSSEGKTPGREYSEIELQDAVEVIDQLSRLPWSNGRVGMWGISWGGFNAIQVAMRTPPALRAILAMDATDDLYRDDVHYIDGIFHVDEYELSIDHDLGLPRFPDYELDESYFDNRFNNYPWFFTYLKNQLDGKFWRRNSLRWQHDAISVPTYLIGGLLDGYRDSVPRMLEKMNVPLKGVIGPWPHAFPDNGTPGPNYEWRYEAVRWWDHWLKDIDSGILAEPRFAVFVREGHSPGDDREMVPGHWRYEDWPISRTNWVKMYPDRNGGLLEKASGPSSHELTYDPGYGAEVGYWWGDTTDDMRPADAGCLLYESEVLQEAVEVVGFPKIRLRAGASARLAHWIVRLEDVSSDGRVALVTGAAINGSQRQSRLKPEALTPDREYQLEFELHFTTWTFQPGHRIRMAVTNGQFPMFWPTPWRMKSYLQVGTEDTCLALPVIPFEKRPAPEFRPPEPREGRSEAGGLPGAGWPAKQKTIHDQVSSTTAVEWRGENNYEIEGRRYYSFEEMLYKTSRANPADSSFKGEAGHRIEFEDRILELKTTLSVISDETDFTAEFTRRIFENGKLIRERTWSEAIPRQFQ